MNPKLSILIPTTPDRRHFMEKLFGQFEAQLGKWEWNYGILPSLEVEVWQYANVDILVFEDNGEKKIGRKRNRLLDMADSDYIAFIDSDDRISHNYFKLIFEGIEKNVDVCSLKGIITEDGKNPLLFEHSMKYKIWRTVTDSQPGEVRYERYNNHLNAIRASIAKQFRFPEINQGEDHDWSTQVFNSGLIKTEHYIEQVLYHYDYVSRK